MAYYCTSADLILKIESEELAKISSDRDFLADSTLTSDITATDTSITLTDASTFPNTGRIQIGTENIEYSSKSGNVLTVSTRGVDDTVAQDHTSGDTVNEVLNPNSSVIARAIEDADSEIESWLGVVYRAQPTTVRRAAVAISIYNLYSRRFSVPSKVEAEYNNIVAFLQRLANGQVTIDNSPYVDEEIMTINTYSDDIDFTIGSDTLGSVGTLDSW